MPNLNNNDQEIWQTALGQIETKVPKASYETWFKFPKTRGKQISEDSFLIESESAFISEYLEQRMYSIISDVLFKLLDKELELKFKVLGSHLDSEVKTQHSLKGNKNLNIDLNPNYTFENFVLGASNELAHAASIAVSENIGKTYNPLLIYSDVGLGKTHLLHAIGNKLSQEGSKFYYLTCEEFTNEFIKAIRTNKTELFRNKYRNADALLLDDIQFLMGKEQTQEGFFHTFNSLHLASKQIVITSDRPISSLKLLEDRITSRLSGGLVVDIQLPDYETRIDILKKKALIKGIKIKQEILESLSNKLYHNIREMEGSLNKVLALSELTGKELDIELVEELLGSSDTNSYFADPEQIILKVAKYFQIEIADLKGKSREQSLVIARQIAMFILREDSQMNLTTIGLLFGGRDHTTVLHGIRKIQTDAATNQNLRRDLLAIRSSVINN
ncbi:MAG: chromosomal replication initiator protein DnaA [Chloroflexi bacterium]|jgi:chromosomal replication initiator protein|nr:chromosomal replication initiator protein DnaA [Chloroflexota bacterium]MDP7196939.1 chromosomal replication initiator protein DnaA [SAR202 cluster bacterium]|tara:strand:+ start:161 stop:1495 length:1335 start_codon:yes stop_codon:yes gene_type:complete